MGALPPKLVLTLTPQPRGTSSATVSLGYTPNSEVLSARLLHFKPILHRHFEKIVRGTQVPGSESASKTWSFYGKCKNLGAQQPHGRKYGLSKNALWVGTIPHRDLQGYWTKLHLTCFV